MVVRLIGLQQKAVHTLINMYIPSISQHYPGMSIYPRAVDATFNPSNLSTKIQNIRYGSRIMSRISHTKTRQSASETSFYRGWLRFLLARTNFWVDSGGARLMELRVRTMVRTALEDAARNDKFMYPENS